MKTKLLLTLLFPFSFFLFPCLAQVPQGFNYQAIARDGSGNPIIGQPLQARLTIQSDSAGTGVIWQELFSSVTTNSFGLFTLVVGKGSRLAGSAATFDAIDWSVTPKFIKTEVNYGGWKDMGTTRFWSVPYSLYSRITGNGFSGNYNDLTNKPLLFDGTWTSLTDKPTFATVATTGNYNDLSNKPSILNSQWTTSGTNIYYNAGNVGIGTATPTAPLHVASDARLNTSIVGNSIELNYYNTGNRYSGIDFHGDDTYTDFALRIIRYNSGPDASSSIVHRGKGDLSLVTQDLAPIGFWTTSTQRMTIAANGNVGINTSSPNSLFNPYMTIGDALNNTAEIMNLTIKPTNNTDYLRFYALRRVAGNNWSDVSLRIQQRVDATDMGYIEFNPSTSGYDLAFGTGNIERMRINNSGNIGIGTTSPGYKLDVVGRSRIQSGGGDAGIWYMDNTNVTNRSFIGMMGNDHVGLYGAGGIGWGLVMNVNSGNVGIGSITPSSKMVIQPPATWDDNTPLFEVKNKGGVTVFAVYNNGVRAFVQTNSAKGVKGGFAIGGFDPSKAGNVELMNITPDSIRFYIDNGTSKATKGGFAIGSFNTSKANNQDFMYLTPQASANGQYNAFIGYQAGHANTSGMSNTFIGYQSGYINTIGNYNQCLGPQSGMNLTEGYGNVMIGAGAGQNTTTGAYNVIIGNIAGVGLGSGDSYNILIGNWAGYYGPIGNRKLYIDCDPYANPLIWGDFSANIFRINGNIEYTGSITDISDVRLKKNITEIDNVLRKVDKLRGVYFEWNKNEQPDMVVEDGRQIGVIAQEVEKVFPELISTNDHGYKMVDYTKLGPILLEAIKDQQKQIETTKQENQELKSQLHTLQEKVDQIEALLAKSGVK